jgi:hypothetical protein
LAESKTGPLVGRQPREVARRRHARPGLRCHGRASRRQPARQLAARLARCGHGSEHDKGRPSRTAPPGIVTLG